MQNKFFNALPQNVIVSPDGYGVTNDSLSREEFKLMVFRIHRGETWDALVNLNDDTESVNIERFRNHVEVILLDKFDLTWFMTSAEQIKGLMKKLGPQFIESLGGNND